MYGIPDSVKPLSAAEEQVMLAVWACRAPVTRRDIDEKLRAKGWAPATVLNFLYRLEEKGWVKSGKDGNRNTYTPAITQRAYNTCCDAQEHQLCGTSQIPGGHHWSRFRLSYMGKKSQRTS